jgi:hypothetical protein
MWSVVTDPVISPLDRLHFAHMHAYAMKHEGFFLRKKKHVRMIRLVSSLVENAWRNVDN